MQVTSARTARQLAAAWAGHGAHRTWVLNEAAESQRVCARLARDLGRPTEAQNHDEAATVLAAAARR